MLDMDTEVVIMEEKEEQEEVEVTIEVADSTSIEVGQLTMFKNLVASQKESKEDSIAVEARSERRLLNQQPKLNENLCFTWRKKYDQDNSIL